MKGFMIFDSKWIYRGRQYEVGKTYEEDVIPDGQDYGFFFLKTLREGSCYYGLYPDCKIAEIAALGNIAGKDNGYSTNKIKIVRELGWEEVLEMVNLGKNCTGLGNSGNYNSGNYNSGNYNSGNYNSGNHNSGYYNSGDWNNGHCDSGDCNSGDCNSGNWNSGDFNSGNFNSGSCNSGGFNSGDFNSGSWNSGDCNKASYQTGCFNTQNRKLMFFDKETDMTLAQWHNSDAYRLINENRFSPVAWVSLDEMSDIEKSEHPEYGITGGYLKRQDINGYYQERWDELSQDEKQIIMDIPNFDADKFFEITGIRI